MRLIFCLPGYQRWWFHQILLTSQQSSQLSSLPSYFHCCLSHYWKPKPYIFSFHDISNPVLELASDLGTFLQHLATQDKIRNAMTFLSCLVFYIFDDIYGSHEQSMVRDREDTQVLKPNHVFPWLLSIPTFQLFTAKARHMGRKCISGPCQELSTKSNSDDYGCINLCKERMKN